MRVLIAEDNVSVAAALKYMLQRMGFEDVLDTNDGGDAIDLLARERFDLVILDWMLPSVSGVGIVEWMRAEQTHRGVPVIMVTVKDKPKDVLAAVNSGVNEYVIKPLDKYVLRSKIDRLLGRPRTRAMA